MLVGKPPWAEHKNQFAALFYIGHATGPPPFPENISFEAKDFLEKIFKRNPKERPNVRKLLKHPFIIGKNTNSRALFQRALLKEIQGTTSQVIDVGHSGVEMKEEASPFHSSKTDKFSKEVEVVIHESTEKEINARNVESVYMV